MKKVMRKTLKETQLVAPLGNQERENFSETVAIESHLSDILVGILWIF